MIPMRRRARCGSRWTTSDTRKSESFERDLMLKKAAELRPRREFLKLAAFTGAAALAGTSTPAAAEQAGNPLPAHPVDAESTMEFLRVSGRNIVDAKGKKVRLRGTCPGGWMNM